MHISTNRDLKDLKVVDNMNKGLSNGIVQVE